MPSHAGYVMDTHCKDMDSVPSVACKSVVFLKGTILRFHAHIIIRWMRLFYGWSKIVQKFVSVYGYTEKWFSWRCILYCTARILGTRNECTKVYENPNVYLLYSLYSCTSSLSLSTLHILWIYHIQNNEKLVSFYINNDDNGYKWCTSTKKIAFLKS